MPLLRGTERRGSRHAGGNGLRYLGGLSLGIEGIPQAWREKLENREHIAELALKLAEMKGQ
jgi:hypothetical protein